MNGPTCRKYGGRNTKCGCRLPLVAREAVGLDRLHPVGERVDLIDLVLGEDDGLSSVSAARRDITLGSPPPKCLPRNPELVGNFGVGKELNALDRQWHELTIVQPSVTEV